MAEKFICSLPREELQRLFWEENKTLAEMCEIVGCKSQITMAKVLRENGIETNRNAATAEKKRKGMSHNDFKEYLIGEYKTKSIRRIAQDLGVTQNVIRRYFKRYGIEFKPTKEAQGALKAENHPSWNGGKFIKNEYYEVYAPNHPRSNPNHRYMYEHIIVMEKHIGRYLNENEVVHHIDGNKLNNNISNLQLLTKAEHTKLHEMHKKRKRVK